MKPSTGAPVRNRWNAVRDQLECLSAIVWNRCPRSLECCTLSQTPHLRWGNRGKCRCPPSGGGFLRSFISWRRSRRERREFGLPYPTRTYGEPGGECRRHLQWQRFPLTYREARRRGASPPGHLFCGPIEGRGDADRADHPGRGGRAAHSARSHSCTSECRRHSVARRPFRLAAAPDLTAAVLDYNLGANNSVLVGWRLHSCDVPFLFYTGRFDLPALPWPTVPVIHKPSPMIRIVSALSSLIRCGT